jgi:hypothetical protein
MRTRTCPSDVAKTPGARCAHASYEIPASVAERGREAPRSRGCWGALARARVPTRPRGDRPREARFGELGPIVRAHPEPRGRGQLVALPSLRDRQRPPALELGDPDPEGLDLAKRRFAARSSRGWNRRGRPRERSRYEESARAFYSLSDQGSFGDDLLELGDLTWPPMAEEQLGLLLEDRRCVSAELSGSGLRAPPSEGDEYALAFAKRWNGDAQPKPAPAGARTSPSRVRVLCERLESAHGVVFDEEVRVGDLREARLGPRSRVPTVDDREASA